MDLETAKAEAAVAVKARELSDSEVARLEARKIALELQLADEKAKLSTAEAAAIRARLDGSNSVSREDVRIRREDVRLTQEALIEIDRSIDSARLVRETAVVVERVARRPVDQLIAVAVLDDVVPIVADVVDKIRASDPSGAFQILQTLGNILATDPHMAAAKLAGIANDIRAAVEFARKATTVPAKPIGPEPVDDAPIFSLRAISYRCGNGDVRTIPERWAGLVPEVVAQRMLAVRAAERLPTLAWFRALDELEFQYSGETCYLRPGRKYCFKERDVRDLETAGRIVRLPIDVEPDHYATLRHGDPVIRHVLDLGAIADLVAEPTCEASVTSPVSASVEPVQPTRTRMKRVV